MHKDDSDHEERNMEDVKHRLIRAFWFTLAIVFLIESWLWDHVKLWLRALADKLGVERYEAQLRDFIARLSPYPTLAVFAVPALAVLPLKILALEAIAAGHVLLGLTVIFAAKTLALGVTAYLFDLCREKLMQIPRFVRFYELVLRARAWAHALVEPARQQLLAATSIIQENIAAILGESRARFERRLAHIRSLSSRRTNSA
jgi:hypothetical protein